MLLLTAGCFHFPIKHVEHRFGSLSEHQQEPNVVITLSHGHGGPFPAHYALEIDGDSVGPPVKTARSPFQRLRQQVLLRLNEGEHIIKVTVQEAGISAEQTFTITGEIVYPYVRYVNDAEGPRLSIEIAEHPPGFA
jgi:hypothetical protein